MALPPTKVFNGKLARKLRNERDLRHINQLADLIDEISPYRWHPDTLRNVELGHKQPSTELVYAWANALGVHWEQLMTDAPERAVDVELVTPEANTAS